MGELNFINRSAISTVSLNLNSWVFVYILRDPWSVGSILRVKDGFSSIQTYDTSSIACSQAFVVWIQRDCGYGREIILRSISWRSWLYEICRQSLCLTIPDFACSIIKACTNKFRIFREGYWINRCTSSYILCTTLQDSACVCLYQRYLFTSLCGIQNNLSIFASRGNNLIILTPCHWWNFTLLMVRESHCRLQSCATWSGRAKTLRLGLINVMQKNAITTRCYHLWHFQILYAKNL